MAWEALSRLQAMIRPRANRGRAEPGPTQYQAIIDTATDGIIVIDQAGIIQSFNRAARRIFGYEPDEVIGENIRKLMPEPDRSQHDDYLTSYRTTRIAKIIGIGREVTGCHKNGSLIPVELSIAEWTSEGSRYFTGILRDLTERKSAEDRRQADEAKYRAIIDSAVDAIVVIGGRGLIQSVNRAAETLFGYRADELIGQNVKILMPEPYRREHDSYLENYRLSGIAKIIGKGREVSGRHKDGSQFPLELSVAEWNSEQGKFYTGIMRDVSDRKRAEEETRRIQTELRKLNQDLEERVSAEVAEREAAQMMATHAERMRTLGQLAGGVAHDFNNVLQAVISAANRLALLTPASDAVIRAAQTITRAAERGASVTERLLAFARRSTLKTEPVDVVAVISDLTRLLGQTLGAAVSVRVHMEARLPPLLADRGQLETVLINLATNARDAMPDGGVVTISVARVFVPVRKPFGEGVTPGWYIQITVADTGTGMDETTLRRAAEPFFTTKLHGEGTGLGLSMAKGFAEQSGGSLAIKSELGCGTTIDLLLPEVEVAADIGGSPDEREPEKPHILLVDDDALVLEALASQLQAEGYIVSCATGATEAASIFASKGADLVLTDLSMPEIDGITLIETLQARKPDLPAILITGGSADRLDRPHTASFRFMRKPTNGVKLREAISACLEAA